MARLIVEAISYEGNAVSYPGNSDAPPTPRRVLVSVSRADTGAPVTGLTANDFRTSHRYGYSTSLSFDAESELEWHGGGPSGAYVLEVHLLRNGQYEDWGPGNLFEFVLGVRVRDASADDDPEGPRTVPRRGEIGRAGEREWGTAADRPDVGPVGERPQVARFHQGQTIVRMETLQA